MVKINCRKPERGFADIGERKSLLRCDGDLFDGDGFDENREEKLGRVSHVHSLLS
jgi:hypothetical protein